MNQRETKIKKEVDRRLQNRIGALVQFDQPIDEATEREKIENSVRKDFDRQDMAAANQKKIDEHNTRQSTVQQLHEEARQMENK